MPGCKLLATSFYDDGADALMQKSKGTGLFAFDTKVQYTASMAVSDGMGVPVAAQTPYGAH